MISTILPDTPFMKKQVVFFHFLKKVGDGGGGKKKIESRENYPQNILLFSKSS